MQSIKATAALLLSLLLAACGSDQKPLAPAGGKEESRLQAIDLAGTAWVLAQLNGEPLLANSHITLNFSDTTAAGFSGCNAYGGRYDASGDGSLQFAEIASTQMLCAAPAGVMQQEAAYGEALLAAHTYGVDEGMLEITDAGGRSKLRFAKRQKFQVDPGALVGTNWRLLEWNGRSPLAGSDITIEFTETEFRGFAGCRHYTGSYEAAGDKIRFPGLGMIEIEQNCSPELAIQEGDYTTVLSWTTQYNLAAGRLYLYSERGEELVFAGN